MDKLKKYDGAAFPRHIDNAFRRLAIKKLRKNPFKVIIILPLKRMFVLWFNPGRSAGLPIEMVELSNKDRLLLSKNYISGGWYLLKKYPLKILAKLFVFVITLVIQILAFIGLYFMIKSKARFLGVAILSYLLLKTLFYGFTNYVENRYMAQTLPLIQFLCVYAAQTLISEINFRTGL